MKLNYMLIGGFLVVALLVGVVGYVSMNTFGSVEEVQHELSEDIVPGAIAMGDMEKYTLGVHSAALEYITTADIVPAAAAAAAAAQELQESMDGLKKMGEKHLEHETHVGAAEKREAEELVAKISKTNSAALALVNEKKEGVSTTTLLEKKETDFHPHFDALLAQLRGHKATHMQEFEDAIETVRNKHDSGRNIVLASIIAIAILAILIGIFISRSISKPLEALSKTVDEVSKGNFNVEVNKTSSIKEINILADSLSRIMKTMKLAVLEKGPVKIKEEVKKGRKSK